MHPYLVDQLVQDHHNELRRLRGHDPRPAPDVAGWRRQAGRTLVSLAVAVGVPRSRRPTTRRRVGAALGFEPPC